MRADVLTLFPGMIEGVLGESILKRAQLAGHLDVSVWQLRDFAHDKHRMTDDVPYGGGGGMLLKPEPIFEALEAIEQSRGSLRVIVPSPQGRRFDQALAADFAREERALLFICGHYEGIDARVMEAVPHEEVSIGDYILTGGELAAISMIDAAARLIPGVLGCETSSQEESFNASLLEHPHYTRPMDYRGMAVPQILRSGNHAEIRRWRRSQALVNTKKKRPDLLEDAILTEEEQRWLSELDLSNT